MKPNSNEMLGGQRRKQFQGQGPNWILIAGGALLSTLSVRLGYRLKQVLDSKQPQNATNGLKENGKHAGRKRTGNCRSHSSNLYCFEQDDGCFNCISGMDGETETYQTHTWSIAFSCLLNLFSSYLLATTIATMGIGGAVLKFGSTALYALEFCCAAVILGIYSYFLAVQADRDVNIPVWQQAVTGLAGATVLYTIFAVLLTCCLGGKKIFAFLGILLDILCCGAMIAVAVLTRDGASSCSGRVNTPLGDGPANSKEGFGSNGQGNQITYAASLGTTCKLNTACFAVAIIGAFLFLLSALVQVFLMRHHKKEKAFGPGPNNGYTKGSGMKFWQRRKANRTMGHRDPEVGTIPATTAGGLAAPTAAHDYRPSHDTAYTGSTVAAPHSGFATDKPVTGGYHTAPHVAPTANYANTGNTATYGQATNY